MQEQCKICDGRKFKTVYDGEIRSGGVGSDFVKGYKIVECNSCNIHLLSPFPEDIKGFYESDEYREHYDYTIEEKKLADKYDIEQNDRIHKIGIESLRGKIIGDFGCGIGLFLDSVKGVAEQTVAIEPMINCGDNLKRKGHIYFKYPEDVESKRLDVAVSFDALEHISNPLSFLKAIHESLKQGGYLYISVPNRNDILMNSHRDIFQKFFYCKAHLFYYDIRLLRQVVEKIGFRIVEETGLHKYDFYNFTSWLKMSRPCGRKKMDFIDSYFESIYKNELIRLNLSSHLFVKAIKT